MAKKNKQDIVTYNQNSDLLIPNNDSCSIKVKRTHTIETRPDGTVIETQSVEETKNIGGLLSFFFNSN